jgi:hypothetical protein
MDRIALRLALLFLFFRISFLHEFITYKIHVDLHMLMVLGGISCLTVFISGKWVNGFRDKNALLWYGYAICLCLATVFSTWRGGSLPFCLGYVRTVLPLLLLIPAVVGSRSDLMKVINTIGWAGVATVALGFTAKEFRDGRMTLVGAESIGDSNDYAAQLMYVMPVITYVLFAAKKSIFRKILGAIVLPAGVYQLLSTGSRGAMVSAVVTLMVILFIAKPSVKIGLILGLPTMAMLAIPFVPSHAMDRLTTLFKSKDAQTTEAAESAEARRRLFEQSITLTLKHPLLGVGPGQFMENEGNLASESGVKGMWHETHNTYTQVSSECGIPALICFVSALVMSLRRLWKARSCGDPLLASVAQVFFISTLSFAVCVFFLSHAYGFAFLISAGLGITIDRLAATRRQSTDADTADSPNPYPLLNATGLQRTPALPGR